MAASAFAAPPKNAPARGSDLLLLAGLAFLVLGLGYPLLLLAAKSLRDPAGAFVGLENFLRFFATPGLVRCLGNTLFMGLAVTFATLVPAFVLAYAATHTRAPGRGLLSVLGLLPLFVPSVFPALGLIYLFGNQGLATGLLGGRSLYGPVGVLLGGVVYGLPHALLLLTASLRDIDGLLYGAARTLGAGPWRRFCTVTLPGARYGLISAGIVVFVLTITDFGVPKVLGGDFAMLATEIFKQVVGQHNFNMGATISLVLLLHSLLAFALDMRARKKRPPAGSASPLPGRKSAARDLGFAALGLAALLLPLAALLMVVFGSFIAFWPYDMSLTLHNYGFGESVYGARPFWNSLQLALLAALFGTALLFCLSYVLERCPANRTLKSGYRLLAMLPLGVPGTVLGLAFVLAFNRPGGLWGLWYGGIAFLAFNTVIHFYTVAHLAFCGSLARLDPQYEKAGACLGAPRRVTFWRVIVPLQFPALLEVGFYLFVNALTTISAVIFLYEPDSVPASVAILQMFDSGQTAEASAMGVLILATALLARLLCLLPGRLCRKPRA